MSLSIIVLFYSIVFLYVKDSFLPIGTLLAKGKPPALGKFGTSSEVDALEPSHILSGSSDRVSEAIGLTRRSLGLIRSSGVAWMRVAQESCQNQEDQGGS